MEPLVHPLSLISLAPLLPVFFSISGFFKAISKSVKISPLLDLIFTSPPYWNKRTYDDEASGLGNEKSPKEYVENLVSHFRDSKRVLKDTGSFFLVLGDTYLNKNLQNIPHRVTIGLQDEGWILRNTIIWKKTNPKPVSSKDNLSPSYEFIFHFVKTYQYKYQTLRSPYANSDAQGQGGFLDTENSTQTNYSARFIHTF